MTTLSLFEPDAPEAFDKPGAVAAPPPRSHPDSAAPPLSDEQRAAVDRRDSPLFVQAGAGSGKTSALVERYVRTVLEDDVPVGRILAITFTEKAAAELRLRVRERLLAAGEIDHARAVESAWVSTIHGFCSRLLRAHALEAGLDPEYRVLDEHAAARVAADAFEAALDEFVRAGGEDAGDGRRVELLARYEVRRVTEAVLSAHAALRSRGARVPRLPVPDPPSEQAVRRVHADLAAAVGAGRAALTASGAEGARVSAALERLERCACACAGVADGEALDPFELRELAMARGGVRALHGEPFDTLERAHAECLEVCARRRAVADLLLLDELLAAFARRYAKLKEERSALDFDDLELEARELLTRVPEVAERVAERFDHVLVDELQDTNRLQSELLDLLDRGNLFTVGDELQAIYGFRGADVGVFGDRREAASRAGRLARLRTTYRMPRELADALNAAFEPVFGGLFQPLAAAGSGEQQEAVGGAVPRVELLAVDRAATRWDEALPPAEAPFGVAMRDLPSWRAAEARLLAARVDELVAGGEFSAGEVAVLVRSWKDVDRYEAALAERGLRTYVAGGGGLWAAREVADLRAYLAVVANPRDEEALIRALGSPLVGASLDALAWLGRRAREHGGLWSALEALAAGGGAEGEEEVAAAGPLPPRDCERLERFVRRLRAERSAAARRSLATLIERVVVGSGYDRALLALPGGERRLANVRKLVRLAVEHEREEGRDLRGFLDALQSRAAAAAREGEAPLEGEGLDAVRVMTIHAAKGLEFPLVCVADLGRRDPCTPPTLRVSADGRVGLRLPDAAGRGGLDALEASALAEEARRAEASEERRLVWVAATRAQRRLVLSGGLELGRPGEAAPMDWLAPALVPGIRESAAEGTWSGTEEHRWTGRRGDVSWRVLTPASVEALLPPADRNPAGHRPAGASAPRHVADVAAATARSAPAELGGHAAPGLETPSRVSYSSLEAYRRCGYRFLLERVHGLPPEAPSGSSSAAPASGDEELDPLTRGSVVHELLERLDLRRPLEPSAEVVTARLAAHGARTTRQRVEDARRLVRAFIRSPLCERLRRSSRPRAEVPFAFELLVDAGGGAARGHSVLVDGVMDVHCREGDVALVVDYKTDRVEHGVDLEELCARDYATQRLVYALAALRAGASHVEVVHVFLERASEPVAARYEAREAPELEARLGSLLSGLLEGRYEPSDAPGAELCAGCPGRAALCVWPPERTAQSVSDAGAGAPRALPIPSAA